MKLLIAAASLSTERFSGIHKEAAAFFDEVIRNPYGRRLREEELLSLWQDADAVLVGTEVYSASVLQQAPEHLKVLAKTGVGVDNIDLAAAKARGIAVCNTPGTNADSVADMVLAFMLEFARRPAAHDVLMQGGNWTRLEGHELSRYTLGVIGMGNIGKKVITRAGVFGMKAVAYDPYFDEAFAAAHGVEQKSAEEVLQQADIVSLHLPAAPETLHFMNAERLALMRPGAFLINTARGELVETEALIKAVRCGRLGGAALDVFEEEPLPAESSLRGIPGILLTPHIAGNTAESGERVARQALKNAEDILCGRDCRFRVNR